MSPLRKHGPRARTASRGFSLIELGIVIAVVAVLGTVVILGKGYITAAKKQSCVELVQTLRTAARAFAMRHNNGVSFGSQRKPADNVAFGFLMSEGFLPTPTTTPWGSTQIDVLPDGGARCSTLGGSDCANRCAGLACVYIRFPVDDAMTCKDLEAQLGAGGSGRNIAAKCTAGRLEIVTR